jgi:methylated-DNA-[protein]-cysteine S-methyltransferase
MQSRFTDIQSPLGTIRLIATEGALSGVWLPVCLDLAPDSGARDDHQPILVMAAQQLREYFEGRRRIFDLPLLAAGSAFQQRAWACLRAIPFGQTRSYGEQARALAQPSAARAVGGANARNPIGIIVPCHRVIGSDGSLTGYAGGEAAKSWLLEHEARWVAADRPARAPDGILDPPCPTISSPSRSRSPRRSSAPRPPS